MTSDTTFYAIGDVHGMADRLAALHALILADLASHAGPCTIIHLGDYIDRGPDSRGVIARIMAFEQALAGNPRFQVISLRGNHEQMLLDAVDAEEAGDEDALRLWLGNGGDAAIDSYYADPDGSEAAIDSWVSLIDRAHVDWLRGLPTIHLALDRHLAFVHAGIDPATFPDCSDEVRLWTRSQRFFDPKRWPDREVLDGLLVVHGHTPNMDLAPTVTPQRINIDTGAVFGGPLTAVVLAPGAEPRLLQAP